ncbi:hypothetical protein PILCRDRAFT_699937 [Piloderma croceum F 1598]|uniref:Ribonuclease H1 N-terminal domain-containing protein n=1 Tax=Piloderma croceum (strain F 1598) TaxID=765440 RepID=A0A0C3BBL2_PILCF|nr:hypothetical protein PILCRDRAFT_699937 [Piloderma croceum F 1598]
MQSSSPASQEDSHTTASQSQSHRNSTAQVTESTTRTWTKTTTVITETISRTTTPLSSPKKPTVASASMPATHPSTPQLGAYVPPILHPDTIKEPEPGFIPEGYYVVSHGQEVGLFYHCLQVNGVSGAIHKKYHSFQDAIKVYRCNYNRNKLEAVPVPGGMFWPTNNLSPAASSSSSDALWEELEDLTEHFNQVSFQ